jgi:hypothetical protein
MALEESSCGTCTYCWLTKFKCTPYAPLFVISASRAYAASPVWPDKTPLNVSCGDYMYMYSKRSRRKRARKRNVKAKIKLKVKDK